MARAADIIEFHPDESLAEEGFYQIKEASLDSKAQ